MRVERQRKLRRNKCNNRNDPKARTSLIGRKIAQRGNMFFFQPNFFLRLAQRCGHRAGITVIDTSAGK